MDLIWRVRKEKSTLQQLIMNKDEKEAVAVLLGMKESVTTFATGEEKGATAPKHGFTHQTQPLATSVILSTNHYDQTSKNIRNHGYHFHEYPRSRLSRKGKVVTKPKPLRCGSRKPNLISPVVLVSKKTNPIHNSFSKMRNFASSSASYLPTLPESFGSSDKKLEMNVLSPTEASYKVDPGIAHRTESHWFASTQEMPVNVCKVENSSNNIITDTPFFEQQVQDLQTQLQLGYSQDIVSALLIAEIAALKTLVDAQQKELETKSYMNDYVTTSLSQHLLPNEPTQLLPSPPPPPPPPQQQDSSGAKWTSADLFNYNMYMATSENNHHNNEAIANAVLVNLLQQVITSTSTV